MPETRTSRDMNRAAMDARYDASLAKAYKLRAEIRELLWLEEQYGSQEKLDAADRRERHGIILMSCMIALYLAGQLAKIIL